MGQEILHTMKKSKRRKGFFVMKIDLEKAYDRIRWDFLHTVLRDAGMSDKLIHLLMDCVSTVSYNVLWNGLESEFFGPQRGLRQGDPISPFLFMLCMDRFSHLITNAVDSNQW